MIETYTGQALQWECDELGHLNMRHYMTKVHQARQFFFIELGLVKAFTASADSTVRSKSFIVRYLKESRPGARLKIKTGVISLSDTSAELLHIMTHFDGTVSAAIVETVEHIYLRTGAAFNWPRRVHRAAQNYITERPAISLPRGLLPADYSPLAPSREALLESRAVKIGMGVFQPAEIDIFGAVTPQAHLGRLTESVGNFIGLWPEVDESLQSGGHIGGALLELAAYIHHVPTAGEALELYGAVQDANPYTRQAAYHMVDPATGASWASLLASGCLFDLDARNLVKTSPDQIAALKSMAIPALRP